MCYHLFWRIVLPLRQSKANLVFWRDFGKRHIRCTYNFSNFPWFTIPCYQSFGLNAQLEIENLERTLNPAQLGLLDLENSGLFWLTTQVQNNHGGEKKMNPLALFFLHPAINTQKPRPKWLSEPNNSCCKTHGLAIDEVTGCPCMLCKRSIL